MLFLRLLFCWKSLCLHLCFLPSQRIQWSFLQPNDTIHDWSYQEQSRVWWRIIWGGQKSRCILSGESWASIRKGWHSKTGIVYTDVLSWNVAVLSGESFKINLICENRKCQKQHLRPELFEESNSRTPQKIICLHLGQLANSLSDYSNFSF